MRCALNRWDMYLIVDVLLMSSGAFDKSTDHLSLRGGHAAALAPRMGMCDHCLFPAWVVHMLVPGHYTFSRALQGPIRSQHGVLQAAVELLVLAGQPDAAFAAAAEHGAMAAFAHALGAAGAPDEYERAAAALQSAGEWAAAGDVRRRRGQCAEAVALYIRVRACVRLPSVPQGLHRVMTP